MGDEHGTVSFSDPVLPSEPEQPQAEPDSNELRVVAPDGVSCSDSDIGLALARECERQGLTTTALAERIRAVAPDRGRFSQAQVSRLLNGKQGWRSPTLRNFAKALGIKLVVTY